MFLKSLRYLGCSTSPSKFFCLAKSSNLKSFLSVAAAPACRDLSYHCHRRPQLKRTLIKLFCGLRTRYDLWKLRRLMGSEFDESEFFEGTLQAAAMMSEAVRLADWTRIRRFCTEQGSLAIYSVAQSKSCYIDLIRFQAQHLRRAMPIHVEKQIIDGKCFVFVDVAIVGLRNIEDFATKAEQDKMLKLIQKVLEESKVTDRIEPTHRRIVMAEIILKFRRELGNAESENWLVDAYKVHCFKLVNYSPVTLQYRVVEFLKPV